MKCISLHCSKVPGETHAERVLKIKSKQFRDALTSGGDFKAEERFYLKLPKLTDHKNHVTGEVSSYICSTKSTKHILKHWQNRRQNALTEKKENNIASPLAITEI